MTAPDRPREDAQAPAAVEPGNGWTLDDDGEPSAVSVTVAQASTGRDETLVEAAPEADGARDDVGDGAGEEPATVEAGDADEAVPADADAADATGSEEGAEPAVADEAAETRAADGVEPAAAREADDAPEPEAVESPDTVEGPDDTRGRAEAPDPGPAVDPTAPDTDDTQRAVPAAESTAVAPPAGADAVVEAPAVAGAGDDPDTDAALSAEAAPSVGTTVPGASGAAEDAPPAPTGWAAVVAAFRPHRATRGQVLAGILCAVLGFALVVQVHQTNVSGLASLRQADLGQVWARLSGEYTRLEEEAQGLQEARERLADRDQARAAAEESARSRIAILAILAGTAPAVGPGVTIRIEDPRGRVGAAEILDAVQELRDAGAEAIQIGGGGAEVRVIASTSFVDADDGIRTGGVTVRAPYAMRVIGDPDTLAAALDIPGGVTDVLRDAEAEIVVEPRGEVRVDALAEPLTFRNGTPEQRP